MIDRFRLFMGPERFRALILLFVATGLASAALGFADAEWVATAQILLLIVFVAGACILIIGRMEGDERYRWGATLAPAIGLIILGLLFLPDMLLLLTGGAVGWTLVGALVFGKSRAPMEYRTAIKAMRKGEYEQAVKAMDGLIRVQPKEPNHFRFRAELLRMWGKLPRARKDYEQMLHMAQDDPTRAVAYNGLAEVDLQSARYDDAAESAHQAFELAPHEWVTAYNLGLIEDRRRNSAAVIDSMQKALHTGVPDVRHRLLVYLYLIRAHVRLGAVDTAQSYLPDLMKQKAGLREWQTILAAKEADLLRSIMAEDVTLAEDLIMERKQVIELAESGVV